MKTKEQQIKELEAQIASLRNTPDIGTWVKVVNPIDGAYGARDLIGFITNKPITAGRDNQLINVQSCESIDVWGVGDCTAIKVLDNDELLAELVAIAKNMDLVEGVKYIYNDSPNIPARTVYNGRWELKYFGRMVLLNNTNVIYDQDINAWVEIVNEPVFKPGDWVRLIIDPNSVRRLKVQYRDGFKDYNGEFVDIKSGYRLAAYDEIKNHIINKAKELGYVKGCKIKTPHGNIGIITEIKDFRSLSDSGVTHNTLRFYVETSTCQYESLSVYSDEFGWSTIIKDEKIIVGGYEAKFNKTNKTVSFGCKIFTLAELKVVLTTFKICEKLGAPMCFGRNDIVVSNLFKSTDNGNGNHYHITKSKIESMIKVLESK